MASADLLNLVNLSLGVEPNGVVNFNYLHTLLHEIVARLVEHDSALEVSGGYELLGRSLGDGQPFIPQTYRAEETSIAISSASEVVLKKEDGRTEKVDKEDKQTLHRKDSGSGQKRGGSGGEKDAHKEGQEGKDGRRSPDSERGGGRKSSAGATGGADHHKDKGTTSQQSPELHKEHKDQGDAAEQQREKAARFEPRPGSRSQKSTSPKGADSKDADTSVFTGRGKKVSLHTPPQSRVSQTPAGSHSYSKSFHGFSMAANDISALEKQLVDIEVRLCAMETLPELLSKKASDASSTPLSDMWNFSNMDHRLHAAEKNMAMVTKTVDDLLGEFQGLSSVSDEQREKLEDHSKELNSLQEKLEEMANNTVSTDALKELQDKLEGLQTETEGLKARQLSSAGIQTDGNLVTKDNLDDAIADLKKEQDEVLRGHESSLQEQRDSLSGLEKALVKSSGSVGSLSGRVEDTENKVLELSQSIDAIEEQMRGKLDADAMAALMPKGDADQFMPKLLELHNKISQMESKLDGLPPDLKDQIAEMRRNIETQTDELSSLSSKMLSLKDSSEGSDSAENLNREVAQLRERLSEQDRALMAISSMVTANLKDQGEEEPDAGPLDHEEMKRVRSTLSTVQQENERLLGTAAHISHEMEVNKEHIKCLYSNVDELKQGKADKSHLELQVREKADRKALDEKASKNWVKSNFEELDRQIREAMAHMMEREEAMKMVNDLNENVDGKVDRMELQPFKDYVEKRLRVKETRKMESRTSLLGDDAAGLKKPLRFSCLSCDKPMGVRPHQAVPTLPSITMFPGSRSFRPYTTFELELIRRQQKAGYPIPIQSFDTQRNARTAGGFHTVTHAYRRSRMVPGPFNAGAFTDYRNTINARYASTSLVTKHLESDIVGADGHVYKGRIPRDVKMQSIRASDRRLHHRPTSSPAQTQVNY